MLKSNSKNVIKMVVIAKNKTEIDRGIEDL
jgi:hypothetical protein